MQYGSAVESLLISVLEKLNLIPDCMAWPLWNALATKLHKSVSCTSEGWRGVKWKHVARQSFDSCGTIDTCKQSNHLFCSKVNLHCF